MITYTNNNKKNDNNNNINNSVHCKKVKYLVVLWV